MDLKELRYFRMVAEYGSFSKAASHLSVAQPALSRQIQKLEHQLGVDLFRRTARGVQPTAAGELLLERTQSLEQNIEKIRREVSSYGIRVSGTLRVGLGEPFSTLIAPNLIKSYGSQFPDVAIHVTAGFSGHIMEGLLRHEIDIALCQAPSDAHPELTVFPIFVEPMLLVGAPSEAGSPLFKSGAVTIEQLVDLPLIAPCQRHAIRRVIDGAFARHNLKFKPHIEADGPAMTFEMVKAGLGFALLPATAGFSRANVAEVVAIKTRPTLLRTIAIVTRTAILNERAVVPVTKLIKEAVKTLLKTPRFEGAIAYGGDDDAPPPLEWSMANDIVDSGPPAVPLIANVG